MRIFKKKGESDLSGLSEVPDKISWYYAPIFVAFWIILYFTVVLGATNSLPTPLKILDEENAPNRFIAERAQSVLFGLTIIGKKIVGSEANEIHAVNYLLSEVEKVKAQASEHFLIEVEVQVANGNFMYGEMVNMYQGIQNVVVKLSAKNSTSETYLLINSHYDSAPDSPGSGDAGSMVSVMMEVMRVISKSNGPLEHPIVFLFNGAEENPLQGSHAFITQHKWAKNCKALINLDAAGNGGREVLFQSGPKHPWIMRYYRNNANHPFATTMAEEMFQAGLIPAGTDFRIFTEFGGVPGLDLAYTYNGYVYHTEFDRFNIVPLGSLQHTGDNILSIAKALANAPELDNISAHEDGHVIFYDFLGWFMIFYTETVGMIINIVVCCVGLVAIGVSMFFMIARSGLGMRGIAKRFASTLALQVCSLLLGAGLTLLVAVFMDGVNKPLSWFSETWLIFGLYFCPMLFGMGILAAIYSQYMKRDQLSLGFRIQMFMHAHCILLVVLTIVLTCIGIRSAFMLMMAVFFDIIALIINLLTKWHRRGYLLAVAVIICQILPFIYFTNITYSFLYTLIPMTGRSGSGANPDLTIAAMAILMCTLFAGFLVPLLLFFRKTRSLISVFFAVTILYIIIAVTPAGFPFQAKLCPQRFAFKHAVRTLHDADSSVRTSSSGILFFTNDRRTDLVHDYVPGLTAAQRISDVCGNEMFCGLPLPNYRWNKTREQSYWLEFGQPNIPFIPKLDFLSKEVVSPSTARFEFKLTVIDHMTVFIGTKDEAKVTSWSFNDTMIRKNRAQPYFIYFSYGKDSSPLEFYVEVEKMNENFTNPSLEIGVGAHWVHQNIALTEDFQKFLNSFPEWTTVRHSVASYESWIF